MNPENSQAALAQLQQQQAAAQNPNQILEAQRNNLGVNQAQETVTGLRGAINNTTKLLKQVAPSVMGRTASSLVTNAQAGRQIQNEQAPLYTTLGEQGTEYNEANRNLGELNTKAQEAASGIYAGEQSKLSFLQNLYNTLYTREQDAERARIEELNRLEQIRQFNEEQARLRAGSGGGGSTFNLGNDSSATPTGGGNSPQDIAYQDVQRRLSSQSDAELRSDYAATLKSANNGNVMDKAKIALYQQKRPDLFGSTGGIGVTNFLQKGLSSGSVSVPGSTGNNSGLIMQGTTPKSTTVDPRLSLMLTGRR